MALNLAGGSIGGRGILQWEKWGQVHVARFVGGEKGKKGKEGKEIVGVK
ncbi:MAG: hypothetical protein JSW51_14890 [Gemmatimonadota bacterium]|nr:MAG: hypothetical protein JSW51_14890 [Gemmatimonadota bacterium]